MFNENEKEFLIKLLSQLQVNASDPTATSVLMTVQAILGKLKEKVKGE